MPSWLKEQSAFGIIGGKWNPKKGKYDKWPLNSNSGEMAKVNDPSTWSSYNEALEGMTKFHALGIGIFLNPKTNVVCFDVDKVLNRETGAPLPQYKTEVQDILDHSDGTYLERSMSGNGFHLLFKGKVPGHRNRHGNVEMYDSSRFISLTCDIMGDRSEIKVLSPNNIEYLYHHYIDVMPSKNQSFTASVNAPLTLDDKELITKAKNSKQGTKFTDLFNGNWEKLGFPSQSEADLVFCDFLAFWSGKDVAQMDRIFRSSKLYRPKWDEQHGEATYGAMTIKRACSDTTSVYNPAIADRSYTDEGVRNRFLSRYGDRFLYGHTTNELYFFNGKKWEVDKNGQFYHCLDTTVHSLKKEDPKLTENSKSSETNSEEKSSAKEEDLEPAKTTESPKNESKKKSSTKKEDSKPAKANESSKDKSKEQSLADDMKETNFLHFLHRYQNTNGKNAVAKQVKNFLMFDDTTFDTHQKVVNLNGNLYNLADGSSRPVRSNDYISKMISISPQNISTPIFDDFMQISFKDHPELINFVMKAFGYAMLGTNDEQVMLIFFGPGANGKSVLVNLMGELFGDYSSRISPTILTYDKTTRHDNNYFAQLASTQNARIVITSEIEKGMMLDESTVKQLTGGEPITARKLAKNPVSFMPTAVPIMTTNYLPTVKGTDSGIWRRIIPVPMEHTIPDDKMDTELTGKLYEERAGIMFKLLEACKEYSREGLQVPQVCEDARMKYRQSLDTVGEFLHDMFDITHNPNDKIYNSDLYAYFDNWNYDIDSNLSHQGLSKELYNRGFSRCKSGSKHGVRGLKLKAEYQNKRPYPF